MVPSAHQDARAAHMRDVLLLALLQGFAEIKNLEEYTGLRVIWLEGNGLRNIQGLDAQTEMRTLYLQENCIAKIEGLGAMVRGLVVSSNTMCVPVCLCGCLCLCAFGHRACCTDATEHTEPE